MALAAIALRLPFAAQTLWNGQVSRLALAIADPTAAGVPYAAGLLPVARILHAVEVDPVAIIVWLGIAAGAIAAAATYVSARALAGVWPARLAAAASVTFPPLWLASATGTMLVYVALASALLGLTLVFLSARRSRVLAGPVALLTLWAALAIPFQPHAAVALPPEFFAVGLWLVPLAAFGAWTLLRDRSVRPAVAAMATWLALAAAYLVLRPGSEGAVGLAMPLVVLAARGGAALAVPLDPATRRRLVAVAGIGVLVLGSAFAFGAGRSSAGAIVRHDLALQAQLAYVRAHYAVTDTVVLARRSAGQVRYYLPEYPMSRERAADARGLARLRATVARARVVVWLDGSWSAMHVPVERIAIGAGAQLAVADASVVAAALGPELLATAAANEDDEALDAN